MNRNKIKRALFAIAACLCGNVLCGQTDVTGAEDSCNALTARALKAERQGLTELAEGYYRRALSAPGGDTATVAALHLGLLLEQKEYYTQALGLLNRCPMAEGLAHQAYCLLQLNLVDSAAHCAARAVEQDSASPTALSMMAYAESERDHHINAIAWANRALAADPRSALGENVMGYVQYRKGNHSEAMRHFKKAIKLDSTMSNAYFNLGMLYCLRNSHDMAIKLLKEGLRRTPRNIRLYTALAHAYRERGDLPKALQCYNQILEYDSLHTPTLNRIGTLYCHRLPPARAGHKPQRCRRLQIYRQSIHRVGQTRQSHPELYPLHKHQHQRPRDLHVSGRTVRPTKERRTQTTICLPEGCPAGQQRGPSLAGEKGTDMARGSIGVPMT